MSVTLDLRNYITTYGSHQIKVIATGEGFRNSVPVTKTYNSRPFIEYSEEGINVTNVQTGVTAFALYVDSVLAKTVTHDPTATADVTIDFTDTPVTESSDNTFYVIATTSYGDFQSNTTCTSKVFGVSGMYDSAVALTRTDKAVGKTYTIDTSTRTVTSDFDNEFPYKEMTQVTVGDNVFISIPAMWWRIGTDANNNITDIAVSRTKMGSGNWYKSDAFYVGKYMSYQESSKMVSKTGKAMTQNYSALNWTSYATANGDGYKPIGYYEHTILTFLWLIEFANKKSTNIINGYSSYNAVTGATDSISAITGYTSNGRMKYRGIEDFVGNDVEFLPDVTANYYASRDVSTYKAGTAGKSQLCYWQNVSSSASSSWKSVLALGWDPDHPFICLPSALGSSGLSTYFATNMYGPYSSSDYVGRSKFYSGYGTNTNLISVLFEYSFTSTSDHAASRLVKY